MSTNQNFCIVNQKIGFMINGIGNGHLTQAKTTYNILKKSCHIPLVLIFGHKKDSLKDSFPDSNILIIPIKCQEQDIEQLNLLPILNDMAGNISFSQQISNLTNRYKIDLWINFFWVSFLETNMPQFIIAEQFSIQNPMIATLIMSLKLISRVKIISLTFDSPFTKYKIPALINLDKIRFPKNDIQGNDILCYNNSGSYFLNLILHLSQKYPEYNFHYFGHHIPSLTSNQKFPNLNLYLCDTNKFNNLFSRCRAILCTSGNQLIQEAVYYEIPVASCPCSLKHLEQVYNHRRYLEINWIENLNHNLDLKKLINKNMTTFQSRLKMSLVNRDKKVIDLLNKLT